MNIGIALGSNLGDRLQSLRLARQAILQLPCFQQRANPAACSSAPIFETQPIGCEPGAKPFYNTVIEVRTVFPIPEILNAPLEFLESLQKIEVNLGRSADHPSWVSRTMDIDWLYIDNVSFESEKLTLPHPRIAQRLFVLAPLITIAPELKLDSERTLHEWYETRVQQNPEQFAGIRKISDEW